MSKKIINMDDVIKKHGLRRYVMMRSCLNNRFAVVINEGLDKWKQYSPCCTPLFCAELGIYD